MPELPDVEAYKRYLDSTSLHQRVEQTIVADERLLEGVTSQQLGRRLKGKRFDETTRWGKYLFVRFEEAGWLVVHFAMSGEPKYVETEDKVPEYAKVQFVFEGGSRLAYISRRMLGKIALAEDPYAYGQQEDLGMDAMDPKLNAERLESLLEGHGGAQAAGAYACGL